MWPFNKRSLVSTNPRDLKETGDKLTLNSDSWEIIPANENAYILCHYRDSDGLCQKFLSPLIPKDLPTLTVLLDRKKEIDIYVDWLDEDHFWFDLDFLEE